MSGVSISNDSRTQESGPNGNRDGQGAGGLGRALGLALGTFAVGTDAFVLARFLPDVAAPLRTSTASAGQAVTVFAAAYAVASPVVATLTARLPRRALLVAALVVLAAATAGSALGPNLPLLVASRVLAASMAAFAILAGPRVHAPAVVVVLAVAWGASIWCQTPPQQHRLFTAAPGEAPLLMALNASAIYVGIGVGTAGGVLLVGAGAVWMFSVAGVVACGALGWSVVEAPRADSPHATLAR